jgi:hypothetical protein
LLNKYKLILLKCIAFKHNIKINIYIYVFLLLNIKKSINKYLLIGRLWFTLTSPITGDERDKDNMWMRYAK